MLENTDLVTKIQQTLGAVYIHIYSYRRIDRQLGELVLKPIFELKLVLFVVQKLYIKYKNFKDVL